MPGLADIKVTLYDLFGYLMPGLVTLASLSVFFWAAFLPGRPAHSPNLSKPEWFAVIIVAYILGHLSQGLANDVARLFLKAVPCAKSPERKAFGELKGVHQQALQKETHVKVEAKDDARLLFAVCDTAVAQVGSVANQEIYLYREGFYRGLVTGFSLGLIALIVRAETGTAKVRDAHGHTHAVSGWVFVFLCATLAVGIVLAYIRYRYFRQLRIGNAFIAYLVLVDEVGKLPPPQAAAAS